MPRRRRVAQACHAATAQHHAALCSRRRLPHLQLRAAGIAATAHPAGIAASRTRRCARCQRGSEAELGGAESPQRQHRAHRAGGIGSLLAPACGRRDAVGCARLARLRLRSGAGQPAGSASADPAGSWQGQPRLRGRGRRSERAAGGAGRGGGLCTGGGGDRRRVTAALGWAPPLLTMAPLTMALLTAHTPLACTRVPMGQGGGGAQSLESLRLRLLAAREATPGQALLLALDAPARDLAHSLGVGWWFVPTRFDSAAAAEAAHWRAAALLLRAGCSVVRGGGVLVG